MAIVLKPIKAGFGKRIAMDAIPADVKEAVEDAYKYCQDSEERLEGDFGTKEEAEKFLHAARSYAYHREPRVVVVGNPTAKGLARFRVLDYVANDASEADE